MTEDAGSSVAKRAVRGAAWFGTARFAAHGLRALRLLLLAYLLGDGGPTQLGIFGVAVLVLGMAEALSQTGISQALIQRQGDVDDFLPSAWTIQILRGVVLAAIIYFGAPWIAGFFDKPEAEAPLRVLALVPLLRGLNSIGVLFFMKELVLRKAFVMDVGIATTELVVCSVAAWISPDIWALVWGHLAGFTYGVVVSYVLSDRRTRLGFSFPRIRELSVFGWWIFATGLIAFAIALGGDAVIGKLLAPASLGIYQMASRFATMPSFELSRVITAVTFPAFSLLQSEPERMRRAFLKAFLFSSVLSLGIAGAVMALAYELVEVLLPPQWSDVAPVMQLLAVWGATRGLGASQGSVFQAAGRPSVAALIPFTMLIAFAIGVVPATKEWGVLGVAGLLAVVGVVAQLVLYPALARVIGVSGLAIYARTAVAVSAAAAGVGACVGVQRLLIGNGPWTRLLVLSAVYVGAFALVLFVWDRLTPYRVMPALREIVRSVRRKRGSEKS